MAFCKRAFEDIEIEQNGDAYNCCAYHQYQIPLGNIYKEPIESVWNSKRAQAIRESILNESFALCSPDCPYYMGNDEKKDFHKPEMEIFPKNLVLSADSNCNARCIFCRDKERKNPLKDEEFEKITRIKLLPLLKDIEKIRVGVTGEIFTSKKEKFLIQNVIKYHPYVKFDLFTNGILGDKKKLEEYGLFCRINELSVSFHATTKATYNKIVRCGNFDKVMKNIELYKKMQKDELIKNINYIFVVLEENYREIPQFIELANKNNAIAFFWTYRSNNEVKYDEYYYENSILSPKHNEHENFLNIIKTVDWKNSHVGPEIQRLINNN